MNRNEFIEAVGRYWDVAYEEGRAGRTHDTQGGIAQITWMRIIGGYDALAARLAEAERICSHQANDGGLWFRAETAAEAYLQQELRRLHAAVEGRSDSADACTCPGTLTPEVHYTGCPAAQEE